jgi:ribosomal protein S18 acetylase RimI-like enzyme
MTRLAEMDEYDSMFGRRLVDEDFLAAGFTPQEVQQYRGAIVQPSLTPQDISAMEAQYGTLEAPDPTLRQRGAARVQDRLISAGLDPYVAGSYSRRILGDTAPTDGGLGIGLADFSPLGALFAVQEGSRTAREGYEQGDPLRMGLGALEAGLGLLEATPLTAAIGRGIAETASRMDPNTLYSVFGPPVGTRSPLRAPETGGGAGSTNGFQSYLEAVNPSGSRVAAEERPNLMMGDMYGMLPSGARRVGNQGDVTFYRGPEGDFYATAFNPDVGEQDVVGFIMPRGDMTELAVVGEMQGRGIGGELQYLFRRENPNAPTGGLTEAGERSLRRTYDRLAGEGIIEPMGRSEAGRAPLTFDDVEMAMREAPSTSLDVTRRDASNIFGEGSERVRYTDPQSGGTIEVVVRPDGSASVLDLEVPGEFRGQGIGQRLQERVMQDFPMMGGQVSSKAAATTAYRLGRRPPGQPDATLDEVFAMIDDMSSVNLVSPEMQARFASQ